MIKNWYVSTKPKVSYNKEIPKISLDDALASDIPVYTRAIGISELFEKGIISVKDIIQNNHAERYDGTHHKLTTAVYIYNHLYGNIYHHKQGTYIPIM